MFRFNALYFTLACILFVIEVLIALYLRDPFIRPYGGDYLVVIFLYCLLAAFLKIDFWKLAIAVLLFAYMIEMLQYLNFLERIGLKENRLARVIFGIGFEWLDMLAYSLGIITVVLIEWVRRKPAGELLSSHN